MPSEEERATMVPAPELPPGPRSALIIATSNYEDSRLRTLRSPVRDAKDLAAVLANPMIGKFSVEQLLDQPEWKIRRGIAEFLHERESNETLLIYVSCHGIQDKRGNLFFAATDTDTRWVLATANRATDLITQLDDCPAERQILILDCCFSGAFGDAKGGAYSGLDLDRQLGADGHGREVLTASRDSEYAFEGEQVGNEVPGSVFTTGLVEGLRTGDADTDRDGHITVQEAYQYAFRHVQAKRSPQTPQRSLSRGEGASIVLARNPRGRYVKLPPLPESLLHNLVSPYPDIRIGAVYALAKWLTDPDLGRQLTAERHLKAIAVSRDIPDVRNAALRCLEQGPATGSFPVPPDLDGVPGGINAVLEGNASAVYDVAFSRDGAQLITAGRDATVRLWNIKGGRQTRVIHGHHDWVRGAAFSPDGAMLASGGADWLVRLWDAASGVQARQLKHPDVVRGVAFSPDGTLLASCGDGGALFVWDARSGRRLHTLRGHRSAVRGVAFSPDGRTVASVSGDATVRLWDATGGWRPRVLRGHAGWVRGVAFSPDSSTLASCGNDMTVRLWDVATGDLMSKLTGHSAEAYSVAFNRDGKLLASGGADGLVRIWKLEAEEQARVLEGHAGVVYRVAYSPVEDLLASAGEDKTVRLWS